MTCRILTREEWDEITPPFTWMRIANPVVSEDKMRAWIEDHCGAGWVWFDGGGTSTVFIAFEADADYVMFKIWLMSQ